MSPAIVALVCRRGTSPSVLIPLLALFGILLSIPVSAQVQEWYLVDKGMQRRTAMAMTRYFSIISPDSVRARYVRKNARILPYRIRGRRSTNDTVGQLLSVSLGQVTIFTVETIRIALGDDLYESLLLSRSDPLASVESIPAGDQFGQSDWLGDHQASLALDRFEYRFSPLLGGFASVGAPESNLFWWNDGTARVGLVTPDWEFALLAPVGAGSTAVGPLRSRLLAPGYGAAAMARLGDVVGRVRFTTVSDAAFRSPRASSQVFVHTLSTQATWRSSIDSRFGSLGFAAGGGYEEFAAVYQGTEGEPVRNGRIRRLSPILDLTWISMNRNIQIGIGIADLSLRGSAALQLTDRLWLETRWVSTDILRPSQPFEQPFLFFITPRVVF
jgi:hypothetical protein